MLVHKPHYFTPITTTTFPSINHSLPDVTTDISCHPSSLNYCRVCSNISTHYWRQQTHINRKPHVTTCATCSGFVVPVTALYKYITTTLLSYRFIILRVNLKCCFIMVPGGTEEATEISVNIFGMRTNKISRNIVNRKQTCWIFDSIFQYQIFCLRKVTRRSVINWRFTVINIKGFNFGKIMPSLKSSNDMQQ